MIFRAAATALQRKICREIIIDNWYDFARIEPAGKESRDNTGFLYSVLLINQCHQVWIISYGRWKPGTKKSRA